MVYCFKDYEFNKVLDEFQKKVKDGEFKKRIPYKDWKEMRNLKSIRVYYNAPQSPTVKDCSISNGPFDYNDGFTDNGFADFFRKYIHEKENTRVLASELKNPEAYIYFENCGFEYKIPVSNFTIESSYDEGTTITAEGTYGDKLVSIKNEKETTLTCDTATVNSTLTNNLWNYGCGDTACNCATSAATLAYSNLGTNKTDNYWLNDYNYADSTTSATIKVNGNPLTTNTIVIDGNGDFGINAIHADVYNLTDRLNDIEKSVNDLKNKNNDKNKENKNMNGFNFDFGPCGDTVRMSMYGMAVKNANGEWVSYDTKKHEIINVDIFNLANGGKYFYKMPVAINQIGEGDIIIHNKKPVFVVGKNEEIGAFNAIDVYNGELKVVVPTKSCFNLNFYTKIISLFDFIGSEPSADQPFGNMLPFMMVGEGKDFDPVMMMMLMSQQNGTDMMANPMLMYMLMRDNKNSDMLPLMFMMGQGMGGHKCCKKSAESAE